MERKDFLHINNNDIIATFAYGDFIVEVTYDVQNEVNEMWLRHKDIKVKVLIGGVKGIALCDCDMCIDFMTAKLMEHINQEIEDYMDFFGGECSMSCEECPSHECELHTLEE